MKNMKIKLFESFNDEVNTKIDIDSLVFVEDVLLELDDFNIKRSVYKDFDWEDITGKFYDFNPISIKFSIELPRNGFDYDVIINAIKTLSSYKNSNNYFLRVSSDYTAVEVNKQTLYSISQRIRGNKLDVCFNTTPRR